VTEPPDPFEDWLAGLPTESLSPRPGAFDRIARSARRRRWARAGGTAAIVLVLIGGVVGAIHALPGSAVGPGISPTVSATTPTVSPTSAAPTVPPTTTSPSSHPAGSGTARCTAAQLRVTVVPGDSAAGHLGLRVVFTNSSTGSCTMLGYPEVTFVTGASGSQINQPAGSAGGPPSTVVVAPAKAAHADLLLTQVANFPASSCQAVQAAGMRVTVPNDTTAVYVASPQQVCSVRGTGVAQVYPVQSG
jgi:hypothetical protein